MKDKKRCQSCGMPTTPEVFGSNADGQPNPVFCRLCFQDGIFLKPDLTLDQMIGLSVDNMTTTQGLNYKQALELASDVIPKLARWS